MVGGGGKDKEFEKLVKKRIALAEELTRALESAEAKIQRNEKLSLEQRLAAIDTEYQKVFRKIEQLSKLPGGAQIASEMRNTLSGYVEVLKKQETLKFNQEEMARREQRINSLLALRQQMLTTIDAQQKAGQIPQNKLKDAIAGVDAQVNPQIEQAVSAAQQFALANKEVFSDQTAMDTYLSKLKAISAGLVTVSTDLYSVDQVNQDIASGLTQGFDSFAEAIANGDDAVKALKNAFLQFAADFLKKNRPDDRAADDPQRAASQPDRGVVSGFVNGAVKHSGGLVGGTEGRTRSAPASWFASAPRYHTGGVAGLAPDEYPTILKKNEEVLTDDDPRNVLNGGLSGGKGGAVSAPQDVTVINTVDAESFVRQALATDSGKKLIMNVLSANRSELKTLVGR
ncbi:hypothetical protein N5938_16050 [Pseudomonas aeruginosa]|uniref:hypothetical protein n=1 Tax=Pseudomonas aeruginosa TaxID=287 RepID=UPI0021F0B635|nr:hypothetical protein [Pseudomonas aeruginosa]UYM64314.1 hypothetical protein N5938_16050 [Pseudomonas aeruginosa]